ncbi:uncharacterized protein F5147DRAFT_743535 [Suillus discolor]|uniref:phenylalanine--tRNA ligase n=1 Tax=Suillus discolor TaxID=1912936 RepID=A0A9P7FG06_9AGAM|nr:uncharacterized protein F5147DRAFT_743535 [Suillus discolor]KAG2116057.1 hypothetical protein F5147DRAFT_743535 [Suillus discolor]
MPTISVDKAELFERLGHHYTTEEFDSLCFDYGLELDEDQLKIEVPANRYDLVCLEGISRALRAFLGKQDPPQYTLAYPPGGEKDLITVTVSQETQRIRPFFACAVLRNIKFTPMSYASFIDLQDKLHQNIGRRRSLVAIGTHDLDTLTPPFRYEARTPTNIAFAPLGRETAHTAAELMQIYESDKHLSRYLHIIRDSDVYPIIYDAKDHVLSMPPIINSEHSKITLETKNVFIDTTATDDTKLQIVINMVASMFSEYCAEPFTIEPCKIVFPDGSTRISPDITPRTVTARASYINSCTSLSLTPSTIQSLLTRMTLSPTLSSDDPDALIVSLPCTRPDIFHEVDIMEDAAVAYGFNNLPDIFPQTSTVAQPLPISKLADVIRREWAMAGWVEAAHTEENFSFMNRPDPGSLAVKIANPKTLEFQVVRTSLLPGLLKTIRENRSHALPVRVFELSDVVFKDTSRERQARNERHAGAVWCSRSAGFEVVHGLLDRAMKMLEVPRVGRDPAYFPGRAATIYYRPPPSKTSKTDRDIVIGTLGVLHPTVLEKFEITYPCSALEFNMEVFLKRS